MYCINSCKGVISIICCKIINGPSVIPSDDDSVTLYDKSLQGPSLISQLAVTLVHLSVTLRLSIAGIPITDN